MNPLPERADIERIVRGLDTDSDGQISLGEAKALFAKLLVCEEADIPDDEPELVRFVAQSHAERVEGLLETIPRDHVEHFLRGMDPPEA